MTQEELNEIRVALMLQFGDMGEAEKVDEIAAMTDEELAAQIAGAQTGE